MDKALAPDEPFADAQCVEERFFDERFFDKHLVDEPLADEHLAERDGRSSISYVRPGDTSRRAQFIDLVERVSGRQRIEEIYRRLKEESFNPQRFFARGLELADITYSVTGTGEAAIPTDGPVVFVANHPFGVVDGMMLCDIASRHRPEFRILINALLCRDEELAPFFLPIDFDDTKTAAASNIRSKRRAKTTLQRNGAILLFPSGAITTRRHGAFGPLAEFPWTTFAAKLIRQTGAAVVPLFFHGCNSRLFHLASGMHEAIRASLLIHEARNKIGQEFRVHIGDPIQSSELAHLDRTEMTRFLQAHTWKLGARG